jgi:hypothetical protein
MASILKVDQLQSDSGTVNLASNLAFTGASTFVGNITSPTITGTLNLTGGQIKFPATQSSSADGNTLDDYEEGSWTPVGGAHTVHHARYTKIGRLVHCAFTISVSGTLGEITLPLAPDNTSVSGQIDQTRFVCPLQVFLSGTDASRYVYIWQGNIGAALYLHKTDGSGNQTWTATFGASVQQITGAITYFTS